MYNVELVRGHVTIVNNGARQSLRRTCFNWLVTEFIGASPGFGIEATLTACGASDHFSVCVPANGNEVTCMPRGVGGAKVEVARALVPEKVDEALTSA